MSEPDQVEAAIPSAEPIPDSADANGVENPAESSNAAEDEEVPAEFDAEESDADLAPIPKSKADKKRRLKKSEFFDVEAEVSSDEAVSDDEDEEDDEMIDQMADFVEDDPDAIRRDQKRRREEQELEHEDVEVDEEDLQLIQENTGLRVVKTIDTDIEAGEGDHRNLKRLKKSTVSQPIFMKMDDETPLVQKKKKKAVISEENENDGINQFIEDDELGGDEEEFDDSQAEEEEPADDSKAKKEKPRGGSQFDRLRSLFGSVRSFFADQKGDESDQDYEDSDNESIDQRAAAKSKSRSSADVIAEVHNSLLTSDVPERFQHRNSSRSANFSKFSELEKLSELDREANWIFEQAFRADKNDREVIPIISKILRFIRMENLEIPFIATYRREFFAGSKDQRNSLSEDELWKIDDLDEKYGEMSLRREKLAWLLEKLAPEDEEASRLLSKDLAGQQDLDDVQDYVKFLSTARGIGVDKENSAPPASASVPLAAPEFESVEEQKVEEKQLPLENENSAEENKSAEENRENAGEEADEPELDFNKPADRKPKPAAAVVAPSVPVLSRSVKRSEYSLARVAPEFGFDRLADRIGISARQLGENMKLNFRKHEPIDPNFTIEEEAANFTSARFQSTESVVRAVKSYAALRIAVDPIVRRTIRRLFLDRSEISTKPTSKGVREIDSDAHDFWSVKRIEKKPIHAFHRNPAQYFLIQRAQKEGFIQIEFTFQPRQTLVDPFADAFAEPEKNPILASLQEMFLSSARNENAKSWNSIRREILSESYKNYLSKIGESEIRSFLQRNASESVLKAAEEKFRQFLTIGGFHPPMPIGKASEESAKARNFKIIACCMGAADEPSSFAVLNRYGFVQEVLVLHFIKSRAAAVGRDGQALSESDKLQYKRKQDDFTKFLALINSHKPSLIVIDASQLESRDFRAEIEKKSVIEIPSIRVELMDATVARIFMNSARSEIEFKEHSKQLRLAISLGRRALDPVAEICGIWQSSELLENGNSVVNAGLLGPDGKAIDRSAAAAAATNPLKNDILALQLHPLQSSISPSHLLRTLNRCLVRVVNYVGVDINKIASRSWLSGPIQFLCGLGPIKAKHLLDSVKRYGFLPSRAELVASSEVDPPILGPIVFRNCCGFIKVTQTSAMNGNFAASYSILDETRIHPERYDISFQIVRESLDIEESNEVDEADEEEEDFSASSRKHSKKEETEEDRRNRRNAKYAAQLMRSENINKIDTLDLEAFAEMSRQMNGESILETLLLIKQEIKNPFNTDKFIKQFQPPTVEELFYLLTGESTRSIHEGLLVTVQVNRLAPRGAHVRLDSGVPGFLPIVKVSDSPPDRDLDPDEKFAWLRERVSAGQVLQARIIRVDPDRCSVEVSTASRDLAKFDSRDRRSVVSEEEKIFLPDHYSNLSAHKDDKLLLFGGRTIKKSKFIPRNIMHPMFRNIDRADSIAELAKKTPGEFIIRPSSKGTDRLNITWKVYDDIYSDVELVESNKPNPMEIGTTLSIGEQSFEDLDQIIERFMVRMARFADQMIAHKNFRLGDSADIDGILRAEKSQFPRKIPYTISFGLAANQSFRSFVFSYLPHHSISTYRILISGDGFAFDGKKFKTPEQTVGAIKAHFSKPANQQKPNNMQQQQHPHQHQQMANQQQRYPPTAAPAYPPVGYPPVSAYPQPYAYPPNQPMPQHQQPRSRWGAAPAPAPAYPPAAYPPMPYSHQPSYQPPSAPYYPPQHHPQSSSSSHVSSVSHLDRQREERLRASEMRGFDDRGGGRYSSSAAPPSQQFRVSDRVSVYFRDRWSDAQIIGLPAAPGGGYTVVFEGQYRPTQTAVTVSASHMKGKY